MATTKTQVTKKLINTPESAVDDSLRGLAALYPRLTLHPRRRLVTAAQEVASLSVALLSGGGSGHEPFAAEYVGRGMLAGAVSGGIFTSPPPSHVLHAITHLQRTNAGGVFVVIPNYTGDRLNFGMAIEKAKNAGLKVEFIIVDEDLASGDNSNTGARGMCGLTVIYKICGALAAEGADLAQIQETASEVLKSMATFGVSLRACSLPGQAPLFEVCSDEMELGTGVHGEAGVARARLGPASEVTGVVLARLADRLGLEAGSRVAVLVNNMGATTALEMNIICAEVAGYLKCRGITLERLYSGRVMTCLDMHGFQLNVTRLPLPPGDAALWLRLLDAGTDAPAWPGRALSLPGPGAAHQGLPDDDEGSSVDGDYHHHQTGPALTAGQRREFRACAVAAARALLAQEDRLNRLDSGCGDGDCGSTLRNLAEAVLKLAATATFEHPAGVMARLAEIAEADMGGTSGGIYSLGFAAASRIIARESSVSAAAWSAAWNGANAAITKYGRAKPGDRTMVDTLVPAAVAFGSNLHGGGGGGGGGGCGGDWTAALEATLRAAEAGAASTAGMRAGAGRASYVGAEHLGGEDAGARGAAVWLAALLRTLLRA